MNLNKLLTALAILLIYNTFIFPELLSMDNTIINILSFVPAAIYLIYAYETFKKESIRFFKNLINILNL